jgi:hypothetical protein
MSPSAAIRYRFTASVLSWPSVLAVLRVVALDAKAKAQERAHILKVPHHGSRNAHHPDVWNLVLEPSPVAVVTPYTSGSAPLPTAADQKRLVRLTTNRAYSTAQSRKWSAPRKDQPVDRVIQGKRALAIDPKITGHIRLRRRFQGESDFRVEMFNGAYQLS